MNQKPFQADVFNSIVSADVLKLCEVEAEEVRTIYVTANIWSDTETFAKTMREYPVLLKTLGANAYKLNSHAYTIQNITEFLTQATTGEEWKGILEEVTKAVCELMGAGAFMNELIRAFFRHREKEPEGERQ